MKARGNRSRAIVITKVGSPMGKGKEGLKPSYIEEAVEASLRRLQTDVIDLYLSHWPDMATPFDDTLGAYQRLIEKGKIRWCGAPISPSRCSKPQSRRLRRAAGHATRCSSRNTISPTARVRERARRPLPARRDRRHHLFQPGEGLSVGKYRSAEDLTKSPRGGGVKAYLNPRGFRILDALEAVAARHKAKPAEVALAWIIARPGVTAPISSATSPEQVDSLIRATELSLSEDDMAALNEASAG